ncbi:hypothetical protein FXO38_04137 [Capsicum annuum]|nr:hypothetical protein FXO38_04137 [Capsicum annuum]
MKDKTKVQKEYTMHSFAAKDFTNMANMREWQLAYLYAYYAADRIMDLNFYNYFKDRYDDLRKLVGPGGWRFDKLVSTFQCDEDVIKYVRGKMTYPHRKS